MTRLRWRVVRHHGLGGLGGGQLVARHAALDLRGVVADAFDLEVGRFQVRRGNDHQVRFGALFDVRHVAALLVEQIRGDSQRHAGANDGTALLERLLLDDAQDRQRQGLDVADAALAEAARADFGGEVVERRAQPLPRHFHQAEARDARGLHPRAVGLERLAHLRLHGALVRRGHHVDEVDDDQPAHVAQPQLPRHFFGGLQVGVEGGFLDVRALGGARRVDVDGDQRFGGIDDDAAARLQLHFMPERRFDLALDLEAVEERHRFVVELDAVLVLRHHRIDESVRLLEGILGVDQHFADVGAQAVADGAHDDVVLLIQKGGRSFLGARLLDGFVQLQQVVQVPLQVGGVAVHAGRAHDHAHAVGNVELGERLAQGIPVLAFDAARNSRRARVVGHQHQVAGRDAEESGERGAFVAALLFLHLNDEFLAFVEDVANVDAAFLRRPLEAAAGDVLERQKAVPLGSELDERGLQARF